MNDLFLKFVYNSLIIINIKNVELSHNLFLEKKTKQFLICSLFELRLAFFSILSLASDFFVENYS